MPSRSERYKHRLLYPIRERLTCSEREAIAAIVIFLVVLSGSIMRVVRASHPPFDDHSYEALDSLFDALSATREPSDAGNGADRVDSIHIGYGAAFDQVPMLSDGTHEWVLVDTLEKPAARFPIAINEADARTLQALPRIGPAMARRILEHRDQFGPFARPDDLLAVKGIGAKTLEQLVPLIVFEATQDASDQQAPPGDSTGTQGAVADPSSSSRSLIHAGPPS